MTQTVLPIPEKQELAQEFPITPEHNPAAMELAPMLTPMQLMAQVLKTANPREAVEVVKELAKLQMEMQRHDADMQLRQAEVEFNQALRSAQAEMKLVVNDSEKAGPWGKRWATYRALNKAVRPICRDFALGISFDTKPSLTPEQVIFVAHVSRGLYTRDYELPMDISGKGPQGAGALTKPNAISAGLEYARRNLIRMIFDLITGEEESLTTTEPEDLIPSASVAKHVNQIEAATTIEALKQAFEEAVNEAKAAADVQAQAKYNHAKNKRYRELHGGQK